MMHLVLILDQYCSQLLMILIMIVHFFFNYDMKYNANEILNLFFDSLSDEMSFTLIYFEYLAQNTNANGPPPL